MKNRFKRWPEPVAAARIHLGRRQEAIIHRHQAGLEGAHTVGQQSAIACEVEEDGVARLGILNQPLEASATPQAGSQQAIIIFCSIYSTYRM